MGPLAAYAADPMQLPMSDMGAEPAPMMGAEVIPFPTLAEPTQLEQQLDALQRLAQLDNAAEVIDEAELFKLGSAVCREYKIDDDSRGDWLDMARRAMSIAKQRREAKTWPWPDASNVKYPLLTTAALQFAARAYPAVVDGPRIVKVKVLGRDPEGIKAARADRVSQHMSFQLMQEVPNWEADVDTALHQVPIIGCAFKKIYPDPTSEAGFRDELVSAFDFVVHQRTKTLDRAPRATHVFTLYPHEIAERRAAGLFLDVDLHDDEDGDDKDAPMTFLEQHRYWDSDGDGMPEPWVVTVHKKTEKVVRLRAGYALDKIVVDQMRGRIVKIPRGNYCTFVKLPFLPDPEGGFYDVGFGKLLEAVSDVVDSTINQLMDAGTLQNAGGGFYGGTINLGKGKVTFKPGEFHKLEGITDDIRKSLMSVEHPGPAPVLFQLLDLMINAGKDIASVKDVLTGETPSNQTATSTMAAIEQGLKVFTAIYKRLFRALSEEYTCIYAINREYLDGPRYVALLDEPIEVTREDYADDLDVTPVADPNSVTDMQRMAKASFLMELVAAGNPHIDPFVATRRALEAARIEAPEEVLVPPQPNPLADEGMKAEIDQVKATTFKTTADGIATLATVGLPPDVPLPVAEPQFVAGGMMPPAMNPDEIPLDQGMPIDGMGAEVPPEMMPAPVDMSAPPEMTPADMIMMGGGLPPAPEAAPVPDNLQGLQ